MQAPPMPTPASTATPAEARHCQRIQAPNWVAYVVKAGETLSSIAARSQTSGAELRRVNCLTDGVLRAGTTIFVPATILGALPPAPPPAVIDSNRHAATAADGHTAVYTDRHARAAH
jgi:LysM repeat protein